MPRPSALDNFSDFTKFRIPIKLTQTKLTICNQYCWISITPFVNLIIDIIFNDIFAFSDDLKNRKTITIAQIKS